jgi:SAM-dependent methyltransferase
VPYQPLYIAGETKDHEHERGSTPARYELINRVLEEYRRPFTILDIGAAGGYFGFRAAHEHGAAAVLVETGELLVAHAADNAAAGNDRVIVLKRKLELGDLEALAASEAFDVVLALNVLHWFGASWREAADRILELGDNVIIETPPAEDTGALGQGVVQQIHRYLEELSGHELLGTTPSHTTKGVERPVYLYRRPKRQLRRAYIGAPPRAHVRAHAIQSTPGERSVIFAGAGIGPRRWHPGINLRTYLELGGAWPPAEYIAAHYGAAVAELEERHGDLRAHNVIIDGRTAKLIDGHREDERAIYDDAATAKETTAAILRHGAAPGGAV